MYDSAAISQPLGAKGRWAWCTWVGMILDKPLSLIDNLHAGTGGRSIYDRYPDESSMRT
jgi:hypothetical protein